MTTKSNVVSAGIVQNPATTVASDGKHSIPTALRNLAISEVIAGQKDWSKAEELMQKAQGHFGSLSARILRIAQASMEAAQALKLDGEKTIAQGKALFKLALDEGKASLLASVGEGDNAKAESVHKYIEYLDSGSTVKQVRSNLNVAISKGINITERDGNGVYVFQTEGAIRKAVEALKKPAESPTQTPTERVAKQATQTAEAIVPPVKDEPEAGQKMRLAIVAMLQILDEAAKVCEEDSIIHVLERTTKDLIRMASAGKAQHMPGHGSMLKQA